MSRDPLISALETKTFRGTPSFSLRHRTLRAVFALAWGLLAVWTPPPLHRWRRLVLRIFGAKLHPTARVYGSTKIWYPPNLTMEAYSVMGPGVECYSMAPICIGAFAVVSQRAHLCCGNHDITRPEFQIVARSITIGANAWICAEAFVGPGVTVGEGAVLAARAVAFRELDAWSVWLGNPAERIRDRPRFTRNAAS